MSVLAVQNYPGPAISIFGGTGAGYTVTMDNADPNSDMLAYSFIAPKSPFSGAMKLFQFRWLASSPSGSPKVTAYLYSDNNGQPNALLTNGTSAESGVISAGWVSSTWSGTLPTLTEGTQYWILLKCTSGTSVVVSACAATQTGFPSALIGGTGTPLWRALGDASTDSGSTWGGTDRGTVQGFRIGITDGSDTAYFGVPGPSASGTLNTTSQRVDGTQQAGFLVTTPADCKVRVKSVALIVRKVGSPGALSLKVYSGSSTDALATSNAIPAANITTGVQAATFDFSTVLELSASTLYRFVLSAASGDNTTNYYYTYASTIDSDSVSGGTVDLAPWGLGFCVLDTTWDADTLTLWVPAMLILDSTDPFGAWDFPDVGNVTEDDTVNGVAGTYHEATEAEVQNGVTFGADEELTGSYVGGGGGRPEIRGSNL